MNIDIFIRVFYCCPVFCMLLLPFSFDNKLQPFFILEALLAITPILSPIHRLYHNQVKLLAKPLQRVNITASQSKHVGEFKSAL